MTGHVVPGVGALIPVKLDPRLVAALAEGGRLVRLYFLEDAEGREPRILLDSVRLDVERPRPVATLAADDRAGRVGVDPRFVMRIVLEGIPNFLVALLAFLGADVRGAGRASDDRLGTGSAREKQ